MSEESAQIEQLGQRVAADPGTPGFAALAEAHRRAGRLDEARRVAIAGLAVRPDDAAGRLALGLTLLDLGEAAAARYELERAMAGMTGSVLAPRTRDPEATYGAGITHIDPAAQMEETPPAASGSLAGAAARPAAGGLADAELDAAFAGAESLEAEMLDANRIAAEALEVARLDDPEGLGGVDSLVPVEDAGVFEPGDEEVPGVEPAFAPDAHPAFATATMAGLLEAQGDAESAAAIRARLGLAPSPARPPAAHAAATRDRIRAPQPEPVPREPLSGRSAAAAPATATARRERILHTLESWLANLGRSAA